MSEPQYIPDHVKQSLERLIDEFKGLPRFTALATSYLRQIQEAEDSFWEMRESFLLDNATKDRLDILGALVGEDRLGRLDDPYRQAIRSRAAINASSGRSVDIIHVFLLSTGLGRSAEYWEPGRFDARLQDNEARDWDLGLIKLLGDTRQAGCNLQVISNDVPVSGALRTTLLPEANAAQGFANVSSPTSGGHAGRVSLA